MIAAAWVAWIWLATLTASGEVASNVKSVEWYKSRTWPTLTECEKYAAGYLLQGSMMTRGPDKGKLVHVACFPETTDPRKLN